jgi:hypothetical protein
MRRAELNFDRFDWAHLLKARLKARLQAAAVVVVLTMGLAAVCAAQQAKQKTFSSAEEAAKALFTAVQSNDEKAMLDVLGADGKQIVSSGDEAEDAENRANFVKKYEEMHRLVNEPDGTTALIIGAMNWPTPIPLVHKGGAWYFDTEAAKKEILYRRVGQNEMSAIRVCQELVDTEKEYYAAHHNEYASKIFSDPGRQNGLYWKPTGEEALSPVGPLVGAATASYAESRDSAPIPYRGYYYHVLIRQGENGPGGAKSYIVNGKMSGGFAFVAYPAEYRSSGVMTFIVGDDGTVYEKDLGKKTAGLAKSMKLYEPNASWRKTEQEPEETAAAPKTK